jgi:hypothetical protein
LTISPAALGSGQRQVVYVPNENANGADSFEFGASECVPCCADRSRLLAGSQALTQQRRSRSPPPVHHGIASRLLSCPGNLFRQSASGVVRFDIAPVNDVPYVQPGATFNLSMGSARSTLDFAAVLTDAETPISDLTLTITALPAAGSLYDGATRITTVPHVVADLSRQLSFECSSLEGLVDPGMTRVGLTSISLTAADPQGATLTTNVSVRIVDSQIPCPERGTFMVHTAGQPTCEPCPATTYEVDGRCQACVSLAA